MSDKFLSTGGGGNANITNGSANIYAAILGADNLEPSMPIKTNSVKQLISTNLEIADVNNLQNELNNVLTNPFNGTLQADDFKGDSIKDKTETSTINLSSNEIDLIATSIKINGQSFDASVDLQDVYNNSVVAITQLTTTKPYTIKAVDNANLLNIDGDTKEINITGNLLVNGSNLETQIINIESDISNIETKTQNIDLLLTDNTKTTFNQNLIADEIETKQIYAKDNTGLKLNGDFKTGPNNDTFVNINGSDIDIEANSDITIKTTDFIILDGKVSCESDITTEKTTFTQDKELVSKLYVDTSISNIPGVDLTDLNTKTQNIDLLLTDATKTTFNQNLIADEIETKQIYAKDNTGLKLNGDFKTGPNNDTFININGSDIDIEANSDITIKTTDFIILDGKVSCESDITTEKTTFTQDKELVSKLYVDNSISNIPAVDLTDLNTKTQNISLTETNGTKTTFNQNLTADDITTTTIKHSSLTSDITMGLGTVDINASDSIFLNCPVNLGGVMFPSVASGIDIGVETIGQFGNIFCDRLGGLLAPANALDAVNKQYVDNNLSPLETRTQNIDISNTDATKTTFINDVIATTNFQVQTDPTIYGRLNNNSVLLGNTSGFSYFRLENASLKIESATIGPTIPQIDFNLGFNTNNKMSIQNDKTLFSTKAITNQTVFNDVNEFVPKSYIDKRGGCTIAYGGSEQNIFSDRTFYQLYGDSDAQMNNAISFNNVYVSPYSGVIKSISWVKENTPASTIQIQKNNNIDELNKFTFTGLAGRIFTNITFSSSDALSVIFRNDTGTSGQAKFFLYCEFDTSGITSTFNVSSLNLSAPPPSISDRIEALKNRLDELTN